MGVLMDINIISDVVREGLCSPHWQVASVSVPAAEQVSYIQNLKKENMHTYSIQMVVLRQTSKKKKKGGETAHSKWKIISTQIMSTIMSLSEKNIYNIQKWSKFYKNVSMSKYVFIVCVWNVHWVHAYP